MKDKHLAMYMRIAEAVAETSSGIRLKVGAVAVKRNMVIATGYNGLPSGVDGPLEDKVYSSHPFIKPNEEFPYVCSEYLEGKLARHKLVTKTEVRHAEANLLLNLARSTESSEGSVIFCTHSCCLYCAMNLVDSRIKEFYYNRNYRDLSGIDYLKAHGVETKQI